MHFPRLSPAALLAIVIGCTPDWATHKTDAGLDAGDVEDAKAESPEDASDDEDASDEENDEEAEPDAASAVGGDASMSAAGDAAELEGPDTGSTQPPGANDAGMADASVEPGCEANSCKNGGTCSGSTNGFPCECPSPFMGERCEAKPCTTTFLRTDEDLEKARPCAEIQGNLTVTSAGIASITESDLPYLTKITGNFTMNSLSNNDVETPRLRELKLAKLREIGGSLAVAFTGPGSVIEARFPVLTWVGGGIAFADTETRHLELPALRTVGRSFSLTGLRRLCTLEIESIQEISEDLTLVDIFNVPASALEPLRRAFSGTPTIAESRTGCCFPIDSMCRNGGFTTGDREAFCGCSP